MTPKTTLKTTTLALSLGLLWLAGGLAADAKPAWELINSESGIAVYKKDSPGSDMLEFKGHGFINASPAKIIAIMQDIARMPRWVEGCSQARLIEKNYTADSKDMNINDYRLTLYGVNDSPWPVTDRDYVLKGGISYNKASRSIFLNLSNDPAVNSLEDGNVRMNFMKVQVTLRPQKDMKRTWIQLYVHADPAGLLPSWAVNYVTKKIPLKSIQKLRQLAATSEYDRGIESLVNYHIDRIMAQ